MSVCLHSNLCASLSYWAFDFLSFSQCRSESSRSEDVSSCEGEEEEEEDYLSPGSSFSCSRPTHCGPQLDESAQGGLPLDGDHFLSASPAHWSVEEVCRFISSLQGEPSVPHCLVYPSLDFTVYLLMLILFLWHHFWAGCEDLAGHFLSQEIDGQALLLLKEEHLMSTMNIKLGPALKICASINSLRDWRAGMAIQNGSGGGGAIIEEQLFCFSVWQTWITVNLTFSKVRGHTHTHRRVQQSECAAKTWLQ